MNTVHHISSKLPKNFRLTFTKLEFLEKLHPLKNKINYKYFTIKVVVLYQVSKKIKAKIKFKSWQEFGFSKLKFAVPLLFLNNWEGCKKNFCFIVSDHIFYLNLISES